MTRRAVVGGAGSGLGRASAAALAASGHDLLLWGRTEGTLQDAATALAREHGVAAHVVVADATEPDAAATIAAAAESTLGGVDVCVLNAGGPPPCAPDATDPDEWRRSLQLLTVTPIDLATRLLPGMRRNGFGRIIAVLSSGVREPWPDLCYSNAGRSALTAWLKTVAGPVAPDGVTVNGLLPGRIATDRIAALDRARAERAGEDVEATRARSLATIPAGRYGEPDEFGAVVGFLASDASSYVTGSFLSVDGGMARSTM